MPHPWYKNELRVQSPKFIMTTDPQSTFIISGNTWSSEKMEATFSYNILYKGESFELKEKLSFPQQQSINDLPPVLLTTVLDNLSLALGISYYKLFCPKDIILEQMRLSKEQAEFWNTVYTKGLGEFFYQNQIDFRGLIKFPFVESVDASSVSFPRQDRSLVGIGGGKDSIVVGELLKAMQKEFTAFIVNDHPIKEQTVELLQVNKLIIKREIDPQILELNNRSDTYNGHVPFSTHMAFISLFTALLYDYRYTIFANEESASYGSVEYLGQEINHQWSKSLEFEGMFQEYVKTYITPDVSYFSLLRPFSEVAIAKRFATYPQYFPIFSSCNKNFRIVEKTDIRWCGECPKCAFTFLLLAAFLPKSVVVTVFGQNLLAKERLLMTYKELLGVSKMKPFDCVGTPAEVKIAFYLTLQKGEYNEDVVMKMFKNDVLPKVENIEEVKRDVFTVAKGHRIPEPFVGVLTL